MNILNREKPFIRTCRAAFIQAVVFFYTVFLMHTTFTWRLKLCLIYIFSSLDPCGNIPSHFTITHYTAMFTLASYGDVCIQMTTTNS